MFTDIVCSHMTERMSPNHAESAKSFLKCDCKTEGFGYPPVPVEVISEEHYKQNVKMNVVIDRISV